MIASLHDYIIKGLDNDYYACKESIFYLTYEPVSLDRHLINIPKESLQYQYYIKKPVIIEAKQYNHNWKEILGFAGTHASYKVYDTDYENDKLIIHTLEGDMQADMGDYVIKGVENEFYPCKPEVFHKIYESIEIPQID
jgi:hypothetical protein